MLTYDGIHAEKPRNMYHLPKMSSTVLPIQRPPIEKWSDVILAEKEAIKNNTHSNVKDCELYVIDYNA